MENKDKPTRYTISQLAQEFGITTRTIRFYEDKGLLSPAREGQHRIYSPRDRTHLKLILRGKRLGFSLDESRELIALYDPDRSNKRQLLTILEMIAERKALLNQQLRDIAAMQGELDEVEHRCRESLSHIH
ncbi:MerR family transcriptional regulator [Endozoicomonadaceae bacterium StTr2]